MNKTAAALTAAVVLAPLGALAVGLAAPASATPRQNSQYVSCVAPIINNHGPDALAALGRSYAADIASGYRTPAQEQYWVYVNTPQSITQYDANVLVNCATSVWLGFGWDGTSATSLV